MGTVIPFVQRVGKGDSMPNRSLRPADYITQDEMFADLAVLLDIEAAVLREQLGIIVEFGEPYQTPIGNDFKVLHRYICTGVWEGIDPSNREYLIHRVFGFLDRVERAENWEIIIEFTVQAVKAHARLQRLVETAEAYRCLDDEEDVTLNQGTLLTGMTEASIRNAASRGDVNLTHHAEHPGITWIEDGRVTVREWITSRAGYRRRPTVLSESSEEAVRVPFAADGSYFSPACRMRHGYQVGKRGGKGVMAQRYMPDYWEALEALRRMDKPYWRRPSATSGVPGTVLGRSWGSIDRSSIEVELGKL
jgi:hypothetical protein